MTRLSLYSGYVDAGGTDKDDNTFVLECVVASVGRLLRRISMV